jgi:hypothetical protein
MGQSIFPELSGGSYASPTVKQTLNSSSNNVSIPSGTNVVYAIACVICIDKILKQKTRVF